MRGEHHSLANENVSVSGRLERAQSSSPEAIKLQFIAYSCFIGACLSVTSTADAVALRVSTTVALAGGCSSVALKHV